MHRPQTFNVTGTVATFWNLGPSKQGLMQKNIGFLPDVLVLLLFKFEQNTSVELCVPQASWVSWSCLRCCLLTRLLTKNVPLCTFPTKVLEFRPYLNPRRKVLGCHIRCHIRCSNTNKKQIIESVSNLRDEFTKTN